MDFKNIIGHQKQLNQLTADIKNQNLSHAYLFTGPDQIGKLTIAKQFAQKLQCQDPKCKTSSTTGETTCSTCLQIEKSQHFDTIELQDDGHSIKIATLRETIRRINMSSQGNHTCVIIENAQRMTTETSNCLLKSLEEPPKNTLFILTANSSDKLLETITSRARLIKFQQVPQKTLNQQLQEKFPNSTEEEINFASTISLNKPGKAINLLQDPETLKEEIEFHETLKKVLNQKSTASRFQLIEKITQDRETILKFTNHLITHLHKKTITTKTPSETAKYYQLLTSTHNIPKLIDQNVNPRLLFENLLLAL